MDKERFKIINPPTLTQQVIDRIKRGIMTGELAPGDQLPKNTELAKILGVNSSNIKEAMNYLTAMGVLEIRYNEGTFISNGFSNSMLEPIIYGIILNQSKSLETLKEMRKWLEIAVLNLAVTKADKKEVNHISAQLTALKKELEKKNNLEKIISADDDFYLAAFEASHNELLIEIVKTARTFTAASRKSIIKKMLNSNDVKTITQSHSAIVKAFKEKDVNNLHEIIINDPLYD